MNWQAAVETTVTGLGYELVDAEKGAGGLLRVLIDQLPESKLGEFITVDDCEKVTRQLQHLLEVEGCSYERLEVSSPGLDRPLKKSADYTRFAGEQIEITLKLPFKGRKKYRGELQALGEGWRLLLAEDLRADTRATKRAAKQSEPAADVESVPAVDAESAGTALDFSLDEVREARLVPVVDFKGRRFVDAAVAALNPAPAQGAHLHDEIDGGRIQ